MAYSDSINRMIFDRLEAGQTCDTIAEAVGVSRALVSIRRRSMANPPPRKVPWRGREDRYSTKRNPHEAAAALWAKVLEAAIREGDLVWLVHANEDADTVGTFTWVAISLGAEPDDLLFGIDYEDRETPVFPRRGDGSVILWDWTEHDATEERIEERDAAVGVGANGSGCAAAAVDSAGVRGGDGGPGRHQGGRPDACGVGA
jgi:hypothetical protein